MIRRSKQDHRLLATYYAAHLDACQRHWRPRSKLESDTKSRHSDNLDDVATGSGRNCYLLEFTVTTLGPAWDVSLMSIDASCCSSESNSLNPTARTRVVREPHRGVYDRGTVNQILDAGYLCHVGFVADGQPYVIPTSYGRDGDMLFIHGSAASRMLRGLNQGIPVCVTVTLLEGLVLARSIFNHSMNYRSVVILGKATLVDDPTEKIAALRVLSEHILPNRWDDVRQPNEKELKATSVIKIPIQEFSAKVRVGPPIDDEEDFSFPTWAGVIPLEMTAGAPIPDERCDKPFPAYMENYSRNKNRNEE